MVQQQQSSIISVPIVWRGQKIELELSSEASLRVLGEELLKLTQVKPETMKLIVPQSSMKGSILLVPFSEEHSSLRLKDTGIIVGKPLRMMGVPENEVDQILKDAKLNLRIAGFEEEEQRMKGRLSRRPQSLKLPQGPYIFCDFRTLELPGIQLNPPPSEALKRMHMLAADPGIIAIMNKHRWRVGIMTEMAPVGYVGISPTCLLGLNKNHGEEISLRLRTDDLKGFRKYETIKKTLLHELAHMVFSEHDESFYALNKQLNQEASALDWTRSKKHTLADTHYLGHDDVDVDFEIDSHLPQKLGGETSLMSGGARAASIAAAYHRLTDSSTSPQNSSELDQISDDNTTNAHGSWSSVGTMVSNLNNGDQHHGSDNKDMLEPDPDDSDPREAMILRPCLEVDKGITLSHDLNAPENLHTDETGIRALDKNLQEEPDPDGSKVPDNAMVVDTGLVNFQPTHVENNAPTVMRSSVEPDTDDDECINNTGNFVSADQIIDSRGENSELSKVNIVLDAKTPQENDNEREASLHSMDSMADEPDPDDEELKRIQDPVIVFCDRLTKAIDMLRNDLNSSEAMIVQQTLFKIIRNVSENPDEMKYKRLRKANPAFQKNIANYKAAVEILSLVGFTEELITDDMGKAEIYLVLKRNDPGLLWLAKSSLETTIPK